MRTSKGPCGGCELLDERTQEYDPFYRLVGDHPSRMAVDIRRAANAAAAERADAGFAASSHRPLSRAASADHGRSKQLECAHRAHSGDTRRADDDARAIFGAVTAGGDRNA